MTSTRINPETLYPSVQYGFSHATLDEAIAEEMRKAAPDDATIRTLKKQKLQLKQEMGGS